MAISVNDKLVTVEALKASHDACSSDIHTYTGDNGLVIYRHNRIAQIAAFPRVTTEAGNAVIGTITDPHFVPSSRVWMATKVFNGTNYVDCVLEITHNGVMTVKRNNGATDAGYQAQYLQCNGLQYICDG